MSASGNVPLSRTPIAIVGMGCLLPGAHSPEEFWARLREGADLRGWGNAELFGTHPDVPGGWGDAEHGISTTRGGFVTEPEIDLSDLDVPADQLATSGRVVRWPAYVIRQALRDAGLDRDDDRSRTGLVLGNYSFPTERSVDLCVPMVHDWVSEGMRTGGAPLPPVRGTGPDVPAANLWPSGLPGTLLGRAFGLGGPRLTLDAACASALYAMALARDYLATGNADVMLAGAVCAPDPLLINLSFSDLRAYPSNGVSQPFQQDSTGIVTGQGAGVLVLKRLADAERDGDRIHAVLRSVGLANDGSGAHVLSPNVRGQLDAYEAAYATGEVVPAAVDYLECHATGTPLGDVTELRGVHEFFGPRTPLLGSVKGNLGHLLTVAGYTSVLKVLLAMRHGIIPETPGITSPRFPEGLDELPERIVTSERSWPDSGSGRPRVGAVSSFGFGGTNAHAVLTTPEPTSSPDSPGSPAAPVSRPELAVTGIGVRLGPVADRESLARVVREGTPVLRDLPEYRWDGADELLTPPAGGYVDTVDVDVGTYRIPPAELRNCNPQHLVLWHAADQALEDAGFAAPVGGARDTDRRRVAVVLAMEMDPRSHRHRARFDIGVHVRSECARADLRLSDEHMARLEAAVRDAMHDPLGANEVLSWIGNIMASRICAARNLTGPAFTLSADAMAGARALEVAGLLLLDPSIEAVLVGGVDLAGGVENTLARAELARERGVEPPDLGDGAAALVVHRSDDVPTGQHRYGTVDGVAISYGTDALERATERGCAEAGTLRSEVDYLELATPAETGTLHDLARVFRDDDAEQTGCAVGSLLPLVGDTQNASTLAALAKTLLCLDAAEQPPAPRALVRAAQDVPEFVESDLYLLSEPVPWLASTRENRRRGAVTAVGEDGAAQVLVSTTAPVEDPVAWSAGGGPLLLPLHGSGAAELAELARHCLDELDAGRDCLDLVRERVHQPRSSGYTAVLVAEDTEQLRRELRAAVRDLPEAIGTGGEWVTPSGSYCTGRPLGGDQKVAFVYPGAFTNYPGAGKDLFRLFPSLRADFEGHADVPVARFGHRTLYPRSTFGTDRRTLMRREAEMIDDIPAMLAIGTNFAVLHTRMLREVLGLRVDGGFGYSLGESSMLFATGAWAETSRDDAVLAASPLFQDQLRGPKKLVRRTWGIKDSAPDSAVWATRLLLTGAEAVQEVVADFDRVFLTHVNSPGEVVIAGDPEQCAAVVERLGCPSVAAPANHVMHCPVVDSVLPELAELNSYPLGDAAGLELLSAYDYGPVDLSDREGVAERIAWTLRSTIDFSRLVRSAYDRGFRCFVEVGVGTTCSRWIGDTLGDQEHLAVSVDRRGAATGVALAQALAKLVSHGFPIRLEALFPVGAEPPVRRKLPMVCGGESVVSRVRTAMREVLAEAPPAQTEPLKTTAEPVAVAAAEPAFADEMIVIEEEPFVHLPARVRQQRPVPAASSGVATRRNGSWNPVYDLMRTAADAHRSVLRTHEAMQDAALRRLEAGQDGHPYASYDTRRVHAERGTNGHTGRGENDGVIWGPEDLLEFASGEIAEVFGPEYAEIDQYPVRVRLPEPPYLFVSRVTALEGELGKFEPSSITTEYDIPRDAWYSLDGLAPCAVTIEAGQCDLLLISYLGVDFRNQGQRVYRLLDSKLVFHGDLPRAGQTLRYDITIDRFVWNGDSLLFFFSYECYADDVLILELLNACAGFFSSSELDSSMGIVESDADRERRERMAPSWFTPLARTDRTSLSSTDLELLAAGRLAEVFGAQWDQSADGCNPSIRLPQEMLRMVDEIPSIDRLGGPRRLGELHGVKHLAPDAWYFRCHFTGDPVLAGSLVAEGAVQLLQVYAMYLGLHLVLPDAEFQPMRGQTTQVKVRGQITPATPRLRYVVEVTEVTMLPRPSVVADVTVYDGDKPVISMRDFGLQVREKPGTPYRPGPGGVPPFLGRRNRSGELAFLNELHMAHAAKGDLGTAMGPEFDIYGQRRAPYIPNGDFKFVDRVMRLDGTRGELVPGVHMETEYECPPEAWYFRPGYRGLPNFVHMEGSLQAAILLGYYLGATLDTPDKELSIRNLDGKAELVADIDPRGKTIRHSSTMLSHQAVPGAVLQNFRYELTADGEPFYRGESLFGYFDEQALANQIGLDSGEKIPHWIDSRDEIDADRVRPLPPLARERSQTDPRFRLIDTAEMVPDGGTHGLGYVRGRRVIDPDDWYFSCHFHRDPVMPGSLGVEAVIQGLQRFAVHSGLVRDSGDMVFAIPCEVRTGWRYRGQILRTDDEMSFELHVTGVTRNAGRVLLTADASVFKHSGGAGPTEPGLRIYELTNVAVEVREQETQADAVQGETE